mmetsp:Transcript_11412/g.17210  ORF Transcript_11412/g.17210 Transcript_11412/m.17210 type:complete len:202 (-) Transcript_11412:196-801(-)
MPHQAYLVIAPTTTTFTSTSCALWWWGEGGVEAMAEVAEASVDADCKSALCRRCKLPAINLAQPVPDGDVALLPVVAVIEVGVVLDGLELVGFAWSFPALCQIQFVPDRDVVSLPGMVALRDIMAIVHRRHDWEGVLAFLGLVLSVVVRNWGCGCWLRSLRNFCWQGLGQLVPDGHVTPTPGIWSEVLGIALLRGAKLQQP